MRKLLLLIALFGVIGCETSDHPGFKRLEGSVHYKLVALGDEDRRIDQDSYVSVDVKAYDLTGKAMAKKHLSRIKAADIVWPSMLGRIMQGASEGDSLVVIGSVGQLEASNWFRPIPMGEDTSLIRLDLLIEEVLTAKEVLQLRAEERSQRDQELEGLAHLQRVLDSLSFDRDDRSNGIYFRSIKTGNGVKPSFDDEVMVHYQVRLANGELVDDTYKGQPLEYFVGRPDQVLPGFATAISMMSEGGKALFVIPAEQAFGERGSSSGIVPPYAALIYEAELVKVRK